MSENLTLVKSQIEEKFVFRAQVDGGYHTFTVIFINKKFVKAEFNVPCPYSRDMWKIFSELDDKIREIEGEMDDD